VGADADIVVWDPEKSKTITAGSAAIGHRLQRLRGQEVKGLPRFTLTRGQVAVHDGEIRTQEGHGKFVAREPQRHGEQGAVDLEGADRADAGGADGHSGDGGVRP
jgi:dihydropyrimidinase